MPANNSFLRLLLLNYRIAEIDTSHDCEWLRSYSDLCTDTLQRLTADTVTC